MLSRRKSRENAFIALFSTSFGNSVEEAIELGALEDSDYQLDEFSKGLLRCYEKHSQAIDNEIELRLKGWNVKRLQRVNLAILRLSVAEILFGEEPDMDSVVINEAVELAKRFGDEADYQFINGVLGNIARDKNNTSAPEPTIQEVP